MIRLIHTADWHLGHAQYGLEQRMLDNAAAAAWACQQAAAAGCPLLISGDIFHGREPGPRAFRQAVHCLSIVKRAGLPALAIAGNHDRGWRSRTSWLHVLADMGLIQLLDITIANGKVLWDGAIAEALDFRVVGIPYLGGSLPNLLPSLRTYLLGLDPKPTILMLHTDIAGIVPGFAATLTAADLEPLASSVSYVALGHLHVPFLLPDADHVYLGNPGALEAQSVAEGNDAGFVLDVILRDGGAAVTPIPYENRRRYMNLHIEADGLSMEQIVLAVEHEADRGLDGRALAKEPIVNVYLSGRLAFDAAELDIEAIRKAVTRRPVLHCLIKDNTTPKDAETDAHDESLSRQDLEHAILSQRMAGNERFPDPERWAYTGLELRALVRSDTEEQALGLIRETADETGAA